MSYCQLKKAMDWGEFRLKFNDEYWRNAQAKDTGETLYVDTRWVVLYSSEEQKIPKERVQNCLKMLNTIYSGQNTEELDKVPNTKYAPWKPRVGNPNIQFLPLDETTLNVIYKPISGNLDGSTPVDDAADKGGRVNGVLNLYISSSSKGAILGQAEISSNIAYGLYSAIGGYEIKGTLPGYDMGKTMAHEVGHALGLVHTFSDTMCDGFSPYLDVEECVRPNFNTEIYVNGDGVWDQKGDNRYLDRMNGTDLSCLSYQADPDNAPNEMGINIMDYGDDTVSLIFTQNQALMMRTYLTSSDNTTIELKAADALSISAGGSSDAGETGDTGGDTSSDTASSSSSSGLSTAVIVLISVFGGLLVIIAIWMIYRYSRRRPTTHMKSAAPYYAFQSQTITSF